MVYVADMVAFTTIKHTINQDVFEIAKLTTA